MSRAPSSSLHIVLLLLAPPLLAACSYEPHVNLNNTDYVDGDGPRQAYSAEECAGLCASTNACSFFSFQVDAAVPGTQCRWATLTYCCWLHTSNALAVTDVSYTSGAVFDGTPCPPPPQPCVNATQSECGSDGGGGSAFCHCVWNASGRVSPPSAPFCDVSTEPYPLPSDTALRALVGPSTLLQKNMRLVFFGDSLTWLGYYEKVLGDALQASPATAQLNVTLVNEGVNGGTTTDLVAGFSPWGSLVPNATFARVVDMLKADVVAIQIGINDILQLPCGARCSNVSAFMAVLRTQLIDVALATGAAVYVASVSVIGESPPFDSETDGELDAFARAAALVAAEAGVPFVDLRDAYKQYDLAENCMLLHEGLLTYDGVHPTQPDGATLLANAHAGGIIAALEQRLRRGSGIGNARSDGVGSGVGTGWGLPQVQPSPSAAPPR